SARRARVACAATLVPSSQEGPARGRKRRTEPDRVASRVALGGPANQKHRRGAAGGLRCAALASCHEKKRPRSAHRTIDATDQGQRSSTRKHIAPNRGYFRGIGGEGVSGRTRSHA